MSTTNPIPAPAAPGLTPNKTLNSILTSLGEVNGYVQLGITIGNVVIPFAKVLVTEFRAWLASGGTTTMTLQAIEAQGEAEGANVIQLSTDDLNAIDAEIVRQGGTPLSIPQADPPAPIPPTPPTPST
jgi:hypothetical protein